MLIEPIAWAPDFSVRRSLRAKRLSLRIVAGRLELVVPKRASTKQARDFMLASRDWVEAHQHLLVTSDSILPQTIYLPCVGLEYTVDFMPNSSQYMRLTESGNSLILSSSEQNIPCAVDKLKRWLHLKATEHLPTLLSSVSTECAIEYSKCTVRRQRTIWGSCSFDKTISLNYKLLLCPADLVHYVIIHELCHILHHNHSAKFWNLVNSYLPNYKDSISQLREVEQSLPGWVLR
jgi:predicted metal-dependent hydrolase